MNALVWSLGMADCSHSGLRTRDETACQLAEAERRNQFVRFVKDAQNRRVQSCILDLPG